ncbi:MAG: hypothetical protein H7A25_12385 [Leptospiraceae bacterium]|nr:hypothetical protein [Leptospiraceae bacterium]
MGFKHTLKVIVSTLIVVVLILMGIYAFIYRNEISKKILSIGQKSKSEEKYEKVTTVNPEKMKSPESTSNSSEAKDKKNNSPNSEKAEDTKKENKQTNKKLLGEDIPFLDYETKENRKEPKTVEKKKVDYSQNLPPEAENTETTVKTKQAKKTKYSTVHKSRKKAYKKYKKKNRKHKRTRSRRVSRSKTAKLEKRVQFLEKQLGLKPSKKMNLDERILRLEKMYLQKQKKR